MDETQPPETVRRRRVTPRLMSSHPRVVRDFLQLFAASLLVAGAASAQVRPDSSKRDTIAAREASAPVPVRSDSAARVRALADSLLLEDDPEDDALLNPRGREQSVSVQSMNRSYGVGAGSYNENVGLLSYRLSSGPFRLFASASPMRYNDGTTTITGAPPVTLRLDWLPAAGDTLRLYARSPSSPATLDAAQALAIGAVGVSTIELDAFSLGTPAMVGARGAFSFPFDAVTLGVRGSVEYQPKPTGSSDAYWTGTSVSGGLSLAIPTGDLRLTALLDVTNSFADSLDGRNLFQGGGSLNAEVRMDGLLGGDDGTDALFGAWYQRPFGNTRSDQPNRLVPVGSTFGAYATLSFPVGSAMLTPSVALSRESASDEAASATGKYRYSAGSWAVNGGLAWSIPLSGTIDIVPEAGMAFGNADASFVATTILGGGLPGRRGRPVTSTQNFSSNIRGFWFALELAIRF